MYRYDEFDHRFVQDRVRQFARQVQRRLAGELTEEEFKPLRLMNGLYLQLHAYMLRVAIPYGTFTSRQLYKLADIAEKYDKGYGHFTTRQNIQFNWPKLEDVPEILDEISDVEMHAIQTSGNCIRNVTTDPWAGAAADEVEDPRPICELIRQWSSLHPEFSYLPRKFKIAVTGAAHDRAAVRFHDIGIQIKRDEQGNTGFEIIVGGGLGRTPIVGKTLRDFLPRDELLGYLDAVLRVYNLHGRRDNKYKARIKILVHEMGIDVFQAEVEAEYAAAPKSDHEVEVAELERIERYFAGPSFKILAGSDAGYEANLKSNPDFARWAQTNLAEHAVPGYAIVNVSLKPEGGIPGDIEADQMRALAALAEKYSFGEIRATHEQNLVLPHVRKKHLSAVYAGLQAAGLAAANIGLIGDIIVCPGMDYCALATARSIPIAQAITRRFRSNKRQRSIGDLKIKISGCINGCGHHSVGHIGILGLERAGAESYQIQLGGDATQNARIAEHAGPGFTADGVVDAVERLVDFYTQNREAGEQFNETVRRIGKDRYTEELHAANQG